MTSAMRAEAFAPSDLAPCRVSQNNTHFGSARTNKMDKRQDETRRGQMSSSLRRVVRIRVLSSVVVKCQVVGIRVLSLALLCGDRFLSPGPDIENGCHCHGRNAMTRQGVNRSMCRIVGIRFCPWHSGDMVSVPLQVRCSTLLSGSSLAIP